MSLAPSHSGLSLLRVALVICLGLVTGAAAQPASAAPTPSLPLRDPEAPGGADVPTLQPRLSLPFVAGSGGGIVPPPNGRIARFAVAADGLYLVDAGDIAPVLGLNAAESQSAIGAGSLRLTNRGLPVATLAADANSGLYFVGEAPVGPYAPTNPYYLELAPGVNMTETNGLPVEPVTGGTFVDQAHAEVNRYGITSFYTDPDADYWMWESISKGQARAYPLVAPGAARTGSAVLTASFLGITESGLPIDGQVKLYVSNTEVGVGSWAGMTPHTITANFNGALLQSITNTVKVALTAGPGVSTSIIYVNEFDLTYNRLYTARADRLWLRGGGAAVTVSGFSSPAIFVFDVTTSHEAVHVPAVSIDYSGTSYRASFQADADHEYLAIAAEAAARVAEIRPEIASDLRGAGRGADYLIVTASAFTSTAESLAAYRRDQGLQAAVIDVQDVYDEFNYGLANPQALRQFIAYTYEHWVPRPRYLVLAGEGSYDYRNYLGYGDSLVPPLMTPGDEGLGPADGRYGDLEGADGVPEMAVGRLPAGSAAELAVMIDKILAYEASDPGTWARHALLLADDPDEGGNFRVQSDSIAAALPITYTVQKVYVAPPPGGGNDPVAHAQAVAALQEGRGLVSYIGHGSPFYLTDNNLLDGGDVALLNNSPALPLFAVVSCLVANFTVPGADVLGEALVLKAGGGAVAVFGPAGLASSTESLPLERALFARITAGPGTERLGDALRATQAEFVAAGGRSALVDMHHLLGDPALLMKWR